MANLNASGPQATLEVQANPNGEWQAQLPQDLTPGMHTVVVTTENGESQEVAMYSLQKETRTLTNTVKEIPASYVYPLFFLFFLVLVLALNGIRLLAVRKTAPRQTKSQSLSVLLILLAVTCAAVFVGYVTWDITKSKVGSQSRDDATKETVPAQNMERLSGAVIDPWSGTPVAGVNLVLGDVTINTQQGGRYNFTALSNGANIRLSHASLTKDVLIKPVADANGLMDIYFEPKTYAAVWEVLKAEAAGDLAKVYAQSPEAFKAKIKESDFMGAYVKLAADASVLEKDFVVNVQEVADNYIDSVNQLTYSRAWIMDLELDGMSNRYAVVMENGQYKVFRP